MLERTKRRFILFTTSIAAFLPPFTSSLISFAVPKIGETFHASFTEIVWVPLANLIALSSFMMLFGKISDEFGRVKFLRIGFLLFFIASMLIYVALNIYMLIFFVFLIGIGTALTGTNSTAIVSHVYPKEIRGGALGINAMSVYLGLTMGPFLGGTLIQFFGWQSVFLINVPVALLGITLSFFSLKGLDIKNRKSKIDKFGAITFPLSIFLIILYLSSSQIYGYFSTIYFLVIGLIILAVFVYYEREIENPLIDLKLFTKNRTFFAANITAFLNYVSTFSIVFIFSIYLQVIMHYSAFFSGMLLISEPILMVIFSPISGKLSDKYGSREIAAIGMLLIGLSFLSLFFMQITSPIHIVIPLAVIGIGFGLFSAPNTNSVMGSVTPDKFGLASGTLGTMRFTGQLISIALSSSLLASALPKNLILEMFSGIQVSINTIYYEDFINGFKLVMIISGLLSLLGVYTSLLREKRK